MQSQIFMGSKIGVNHINFPNHKILPQGNYPPAPLCLQHQLLINLHSAILAQREKKREEGSPQGQCGNVEFLLEICHSRNCTSLTLVCQWLNLYLFGLSQRIQDPMCVVCRYYNIPANCPGLPWIVQPLFCPGVQQFSPDFDITCDAVIQQDLHRE